MGVIKIAKVGTLQRCLHYFVAATSIFVIITELRLLTLTYPEPTTQAFISIASLSSYPSYPSYPSSHQHRTTQQTNQFDERRRHDDGSYGAVPKFHYINSTYPLFSKLELIDRRLQPIPEDPDYGYLDLGGLNLYNDPVRKVNPKDYELAEKHREELLEKMEKNAGSASPYLHDEELEEEPLRDGKCYRNNWKSKFYPVCNTFQENSMEENVRHQHNAYLGSGYFRDAWYSNKTGTTLKTLRLSRPQTLRQTMDIAKEATILERLTASPRIVNIYGFCGASMFVEYLPHEVELEIHTQLERDEVREVYEKHNKKAIRRNETVWAFPMNNLTSVEKLKLAIDMAESLADIHGFSGGTIFHGDLHPEQYLRDPQGVLKLNDFNNGIVLDWNHQKGAYCLDYHPFAGSFHAPEEHLKNRTIDDKADVFAFGSILFTVVTGLYPYWEDHLKQRHAKIRHGELPPLDARYRSEKDLPIEAALIKVMEKCYTYQSKDRPRIFQVIEWLKKIHVP